MVEAMGERMGQMERQLNQVIKTSRSLLCPPPLYPSSPSPPHHHPPPPYLIFPPPPHWPSPHSFMKTPTPLVPKFYSLFMGVVLSVNSEVSGVKC